MEYNLILSHRHYKLLKVGAKKATVTFKEGTELQQYLGWLLLNRDCRIIVHNSNAEVTQVLHSKLTNRKCCRGKQEDVLPLISRERAEFAVGETDCSERKFTPIEKEDNIRFVLYGAEIQRDKDYFDSGRVI